MKICHYLFIAWSVWCRVIGSVEASPMDLFSFDLFLTHRPRIVCHSLFELVKKKKPLQLCSLVPMPTRFSFFGLHSVETRKAWEHLSHEWQRVGGRCPTLFVNVDLFHYVHLRCHSRWLLSGKKFSLPITLPHSVRGATPEILGYSS